MENFNPESREQPQGVGLRIVSPDGDKHHMLGFDARTPDEARAYNEVIEHYLELKYNTVFHQVGGDNDVGYHAWEIWDDDIDTQWIEEKFQEIQQDAQVLMQENDLDVIYEKVYEKWDQQKDRNNL